MNDSAGPTVSAWQKTSPDFSGPLLRDDTTADVCVIGAGIGGLTTAYLLARENVRVVVLEAGALASGESARTTAHLSNVLDDRFYQIERRHGADAARAAAQSHGEAINRIEQIVRDENIDCDFRRVDGYLFAPQPDGRESLKRERDAARRAGLETTDWAESPHGIDLGGRECLRFHRQAQFHPLRYLRGLIDAIEREESRVYAETRVRDVTEGPECIITTENGYRVRAGAVVIATNSPINNRIALHTKLAAYRTYVVAATVPHGSVAKALYWDDLDPYHYVRVGDCSETVDTLLIGGEDHRTGQDEHPTRHFDRLELWARERFPQIQNFTDRWSGQVLETPDGLAFIGRNPGSVPNVYVITGDSGMGMTHGTLGGILVSDLIQGRPNIWQNLYAPERIPLGSAVELVEENLNMARQYFDWARHFTSDVADLPLNSGRVIQRDREKIAVFRSADGHLHEMSAVCRHLGCIVHWNDAEHTWDCPCHGSRYTATGEVINGPATTPLTPHPTPAPVDP